VGVTVERFQQCGGNRGYLSSKYTIKAHQKMHLIVASLKDISSVIESVEDLIAKGAEIYLCGKWKRAIATEKRLPAIHSLISNDLGTKKRLMNVGMDCLKGTRFVQKRVRKQEKKPLKIEEMMRLL
jgi:hypothetical protein